MKLKKAILHIESTCTCTNHQETIKNQHTESAILKVDSLLLAKLAACSRWLPMTDGFQYDLISKEMKMHVCTQNDQKAAYVEPNLYVRQRISLIFLSSRSLCR